MFGIVLYNDYRELLAAPVLHKALDVTQRRIVAVSAPDWVTEALLDIDDYEYWVCAQGLLSERVRRGCTRKQIQPMQSLRMGKR